MSKADEEAQKILGYYRQMDEVSKILFAEFVYALGRDNIPRDVLRERYDRLIARHIAGKAIRLSDLETLRHP